MVLSFPCGQFTTYEDMYVFQFSDATIIDIDSLVSPIRKEVEKGISKAELLLNSLEQTADSSIQSAISSLDTLVAAIKSNIQNTVEASNLPASCLTDALANVDNAVNSASKY